MSWSRPRKILKFYYYYYYSSLAEWALKCKFCVVFDKQPKNSLNPMRSTWKKVAKIQKRFKIWNFFLILFLLNLLGLLVTVSYTCSKYGRDWNSGPCRSVHKLFSSGLIFSVLFIYHSIPAWFSLFKVKLDEITGAEWI